MRFYLGTHRPNWLWKPEFRGIPLFLCHRTLRTKSAKTPFPPAVTRYGVDSGAYTELTTYGRWVETPEQYVAWLRRYADELGPFDFAGQQDWVCKKDALDAIERETGVRPEVIELLQATVTNLLRLRELAPDLPIAPTIQGDTVDDYLLCADLFAAAGVDLTAEPVVGVGSLVGKKPRDVERIATLLHDRGITTLHGFGVKGEQLPIAAHGFATADSMAWSKKGRFEPYFDCPHKGCQNCPRFALDWWHETVGTAAGPQQLAFAI